jgi:heme/copper-type cytochrome/quinol oxidase subunit 2
MNWKHLAIFGGWLLAAFLVVLGPGLANDNLAAAITWFVFLLVTIVGVSIWFSYLRYRKYGRQCDMLDGMRMHRNKPLESFDHYAPIMSGEDQLNKIVPTIAVPSVNPCPIL